MTHAVH